jgi:acetyl-CoA carboxylase biotin carboxylase subunit
MGDKAQAKYELREAGVPLVPGSDGTVTVEQARASATEIGFPVLLKAAAGGGGKGMRLVADESELPSAFDTARSEAAAAFGDPSVYIEKAVERPRHIEIQVFADTHGRTVHLGERECSIQRRHQKVIEECPSPIGDPALREAMGAAAVRIARAASYVGAGTVEFLVSDVTRDFYFLEMNTRLQVEHPVTELVTGRDLVREQIRVAAGLPLSFTQEEVTWTGHAVECRVYAEDPEQNFMPSPGRITSLRVPAGPGVRDDGGVYEGAEVPIYYDPMISKLATWGRTRDEAIERMRRALDEYTVDGIKTTLPFFREVMRDAEFVAGRLDTAFISHFNERRAAAVASNDEAVSDAETARRDIATIAAALAYAEPARNGSQPQTPPAPPSRWKLAGRDALHRSRL